MAQPAKELVSGTLTGKEGPTDLPTDRPTDSCKLSSELRMLTEHSQALTDKQRTIISKGEGAMGLGSEMAVLTWALEATAGVGRHVATVL